MAMPPQSRTRQSMQRSKLPLGHSIEDQVRLSYYVPAPSHYRPKAAADIVEPKVLGKISDSKVPSVHDHFPKSKSWVPGPGSYHTPDLGDFQLPEGGRVNTKPPDEEKIFKLDEYPRPDPGAYGVPDHPGRPRQLYGQFSKDPRVSKFIQDEVRRSKSVPAPGEYEVCEANIGEQVRGAPRPAKPFCPDGGKTLHIGKTPSYFDHAPKRFEGKPGPDRYDLPGSVRPNKAVGQTVFKYQSATLAETKAMVNRIALDEPGPGSYDLPDPPPMPGVPSLKGKQFGHAMPAPYAYNCAPDLGRKYDSIAPVRQHNSADQIYGTGVRRDLPRFTGAAASRGSRPSSAGSQARKEKVNIAEVATGTSVFDLNPEDAVQWRSGGFAPLKKSRSATAVQPALHPVVEERKKYYPELSGKSRKRRTVLPLAVRKPEPVSTRDDSDEYQRLCRGKVQLAAVAQNLENTTSAVFEPLDTEKMKKEAVESLVDKAKAQMKMEGVAPGQQDRVLSEMLGVLKEQGMLDDDAIERLRPGTAASKDAGGHTAEAEQDGEPP
mmetsp:Transcript_83005/g.231668  ORF Transcript_83005/g.231668 Transcript_83005/m.231668 type:complete len:547 (-) Transcript_83005:257-1897(-)